MSSRLAIVVTAGALLAAIGIGIGCSGGSSDSTVLDEAGSPVDSALTVPQAFAAESEAQPIDEFAQTLATLGAEAPLTPPAPLAVVVADKRTEPELDVAALAEEVKALRVEMDELGRTLDVYLDTVIADLKDENVRLRQEIARLYEEGAATTFQPEVPQPGQSFLGQVLRETPQVPGLEGESPDSAIEPNQLSPEEGFNGEAYTIVREWGRTPEDVVTLGKDVPSLKGMICAVPQGISEPDLVALGRRLRSEAEGYDNINIEVFAGMEAAQYYAEQNKAKPGSRVMSVSKHTASGRDVILLMTGGVTREIPASE